MVFLLKLKKYISIILRSGLAVGMLYYLVQSGSIDWSSLAGLARAWEYTILAIILFTISAVLQAWRLQILINAHHLNLSFLASVRLTFIGIFFNTYLPGATGGDLVKIYYASKGNPEDRTEVITILLLDRFIGLFSLLLLPLLIVPFFIEVIETQKILMGLLGTSLIFTLVIVVIVFIGARYDVTNSKILNWIENKTFIGNTLTRVLYTIHSYKNNKAVIIKALLLSFLLQSTMVLVSLVISEATNPAGADIKMIILIPLGYLANSLPVTPGGIGVGEAALESLFNLFSLQGGAEVILGWRLIMVVVGLAGLGFYLKGEKRFVFKTGQDDTPD